jgi:hypothetical protein
MKIEFMNDAKSGFHARHPCIAKHGKAEDDRIDSLIGVQGLDADCSPPRAVAAMRAAGR